MLSGLLLAMNLGDINEPHYVEYAFENHVFPLVGDISLMCAGCPGRITGWTSVRQGTLASLGGRNIVITVVGQPQGSRADSEMKVSSSKGSCEVVCRVCKPQILKGIFNYY